MWYEMLQTIIDIYYNVWTKFLGINISFNGCLQVHCVWNTCVTFSCVICLSYHLHWMPALKWRFMLHSNTSDWKYPHNMKNNVLEIRQMLLEIIYYFHDYSCSWLTDNISLIDKQSKIKHENSCQYLPDLVNIYATLYIYV